MAWRWRTASRAWWRGADQAHLTINGIGERSGNTSLEEFVMGCFNLYGLRTNVDYSLLYETSRLVSRLTGVVIQPNKAIIGDNAFGHESGIHTHGILSNPSTYEPFDPSMVGRTQVAPGGQARGEARDRLPAAGDGLKPKEDSLRLIVERVKEMGDKGSSITDSRPLPARGPDNGRGHGGVKATSSSSRGSRSSQG